MDWLMKVCQNIEMLPVRLMNYLWSREHDICLRTKLPKALAEDALVQSCPERKFLVI